MPPPTPAVHITPTNAALGVAIRHLRHARDLTIEGLAHAADMHRPTCRASSGADETRPGTRSRHSHALSTSPCLRSHEMPKYKRNWPRGCVRPAAILGWPHDPSDRQSNKETQTEASQAKAPGHD